MIYVNQEFHNERLKEALLSVFQQNYTKYKTIIVIDYLNNN